MARSRAKRKKSADAPPKMKRRRARAAKRRIDKVTTTRTSTKFFMSNPVDMNILNDILPGVAGYAGARLLGRIAMVQIGKRWPQFGKWANVIGAGVGFGATWLLGNKIQPVERWHQPITVGAGIAAAQTVLQATLPQLGWIVSDADMSQYAQPTTPILTPVTPAPTATADDEDDYGFDDEEAPANGAAPVTDDKTDDQGTDEDFDQGIFSNEDG